MATIERATNHHNVLVVTGDDLYSRGVDDPNVFSDAEGRRRRHEPRHEG